MPKKNPPLPPGPCGLPLVRNIFSLDQYNLHKCLAKLSETYGPVMKIRLGTRFCIVINSATIAKEVHKDHDNIFANRDITAAASAASWAGTDIVWSPHGDHWRMLRKICVQDLLNSTRLDALYDLRREIRSMVNTIYSKTFNSIDIGDHIFHNRSLVH
ncbi:hypothetical protein AQUCO_01200114v1 [Aquilegia coerulea]|uniref:Cytochrome P450 n=1 Tax=Aquilegia coerulea TaxID=218851 RepID=A0A2G5E4K1_AQUCA|nr:hypothetical protein AQUCO_01200114v1 [Aquilegia coerulea]